jgi:hypothetical protein
MALIKCSACSKEISENTAACPWCGEKIPKKTSRFTWAILAFFLIVIGMKIFPSGPVASAPDIRTADQLVIDAKESRKMSVQPIIEARRMLKNSSKDADSLQFRGEFNSVYGSGSEVVCGEVNGKNSFGGYSGFKQFIVQGRTSMVNNQDEKSFDSAWSKFCSK